MRSECKVCQLDKAEMTTACQELTFQSFSKDFSVNKAGRKTQLYVGAMVFDRVQKVFNFAGQQPPKGAKLKNKRQNSYSITSRAYCCTLTESRSLIEIGIPANTCHSVNQSGGNRMMVSCLSLKTSGGAV